MNNEWIGWGGGTCPVGADVRVDVRFRRGGEEVGAPARDWSWSSHDDEDDIIAYRLHEPAKPASAWINCSDRMPDVDGAYLCWDGRNVDVYQLARNHWVANHFGQFRVTHWQPLPVAPEDGK